MYPKIRLCLRVLSSHLLSNFFFSLKTVREFCSAVIVPQIVVERFAAETFQRCIPVSYLERGNLYEIGTVARATGFRLL